MTGESPRKGPAGLASNAAVRKAFTVLTVGFVSGISLIIGEVALVSLAFSGQLAPYLSQGIGLILFGTAAACVVTGLGSGLASQRNLPPPVFGTVVFAPDDDQALEHCEDVLISSYEPPDGAEGGELSLLKTVGADLERHLDRQVLFEELVGDLRDWLDTREHAEGDALLDVGESNDTLQLITAGRASVFDAGGARRRQLGPGDAVEPRGPVAAPTAAASVVADEPCTTATLTASARRLLEESDPKLTARLYRYVLSAGVPTAARSTSRPRTGIAS